MYKYIQIARIAPVKSGVEKSTIGRACRPPCQAPPARQMPLQGCRGGSWNEPRRWSPCIYNGNRHLEGLNRGQFIAHSLGIMGFTCSLQVVYIYIYRADELCVYHLYKYKSCRTNNATLVNAYYIYR